MLLKMVCLISGLNVAKTFLTLFSTRVEMSAYTNPFIELAPVLDAAPHLELRFHFHFLCMKALEASLSLCAHTITQRLI